VRKEDWGGVMGGKKMGQPHKPPPKCSMRLRVLLLGERRGEGQAFLWGGIIALRGGGGRKCGAVRS